MATPPSSETVQGEQVGQKPVEQRSIQTSLPDSALKSVSKMKSVLAKRKASTGKRRKSSGLNVPIVRSPLLKWQLLSLAVLKRRLTSPSVRGHGLPPALLDGSSLRGDGLPPTVLDGSSLRGDGPPPVLDGSSVRGDGLPPAVLDGSYVREDELPQAILDGSSSSSPPPQGASRRRATKRRKLRSSVWKEFEPIYNGNLTVQAKCIHCLDIFAADRENGRSACRRHLEVCKERIRMNQMVESIRKDSMSPDAMALKNRKFDQEVSREAMMNFIVLQELPFSLVEHEPFRKFTATLNPWFEIVSRTTVVQDILSSFESRKLALKEIIKDSDSRVSLTADFWTPKQNLGYLCITCHFINKEWKLQKRIISFSVVASPHDGLTMFNALLKSLKDWHLDKKVFSITLDNANNNKKMMDYLSQNLRERQLLKGNSDMLHMCCAAHVFNLIIQDGFKLIESATTHIRDSVKYIRTGLARKQRFEEIIVQLGIACDKKPCLDVPTRWNSTYLTLLSAKEYRPAFEALHSQDLCYMDLPSPDKWKMADLLCEILKPFL